VRFDEPGCYKELRCVNPLGIRWNAHGVWMSDFGDRSSFNQ